MLLSFLALKHASSSGQSTCHSAGDQSTRVLMRNIIKTSDFCFNFIFLVFISV